MRKIFALVQQLDWADGSISDDTEMSLDEFREALVALTLYINPSPFRAIDQRVEEGLELLLADTNRLRMRARSCRRVAGSAPERPERKRCVKKYKS